MNMNMNETSTNMKVYIKDKNALEQEIKNHVYRLADYLKQGQVCSDCPIDFQHQLREFVDMVAHATACDTSSASASQLCQYPNCSNGKRLYRHDVMCTEKSMCRLCYSMFQLFKFHAGQCKQSTCTLPHCREIKKDNARRAESRQRRLRRKEQGLSWMQRRLHFMRVRGEEETRALEAKIRAEEEKISVLKVKMGGYYEQIGEGYELKRGEQEEELRRRKERRRLQREVEHHLLSINIT